MVAMLLVLVFAFAWVTEAVAIGLWLNGCLQRRKKGGRAQESPASMWVQDEREKWWHSG